MADGVEDHIGRRFAKRIYPQKSFKRVTADVVGARGKLATNALKCMGNMWYHYEVFDLTALRPFSTG